MTSRTGDPSARAARDVPAARDFPALASAKWKQGSSPDRDALAQIGVGLDKDRVRSLLSWPHFQEGIVGVREWNYIFHLKAARGSGPLTCQFMVRFDEQMRTSGAYWKTPECKAGATASATPLVVKPVAPLPLRDAGVDRVVLSTDRLFDHASAAAGQAAFLPEGAQIVRLLAEQIRSNFRSVESIRLTAHTDRLESAAAGERLSLDRALKVRDLLVRYGIDPSAVQVEARAAAQPLVTCPGPRSPQVELCLRPNRRVEVDVTGAQ